MDDAICRWEGDDLLLSVRVQPRASRQGVTGLHGDAVKVALNAPPVEGAANKALCRWLAEELQVAKGRVTIEQGDRSRDKRLRVAGVTRDAVARFCRDWKIPGPV